MDENRQWEIESTKQRGPPSQVVARASAGGSSGLGWKWTGIWMYVNLQWEMESTKQIGPPSQVVARASARGTTGAASCISVGVIGKDRRQARLANP